MAPTTWQRPNFKASNMCKLNNVHKNNLKNWWVDFGCTLSWLCQCESDQNINFSSENWALIWKQYMWSTCFHSLLPLFRSVLKKRQTQVEDPAVWRNCKLLKTNTLSADKRSKASNKTNINKRNSLQFPSRLSMLWAFFSSFLSFSGDRISWETDFA